MEQYMGYHTPSTYRMKVWKLLDGIWNWNESLAMFRIKGFAKQRYTRSNGRVVSRVSYNIIVHDHHELHFTALLRIKCRKSVFEIGRWGGQWFLRCDVGVWGWLWHFGQRSARIRRPIRSRCEYTSFVIERNQTLSVLQLAQPAAFLRLHTDDHADPSCRIKIQHGTTTLAFRFQGGVIVAVDSRATAGSYVGVYVPGDNYCFPNTIFSIGNSQEGHWDQPLLVGYDGWRCWYEADPLYWLALMSLFQLIVNTGKHTLACIVDCMSSGTENGYQYRLLANTWAILCIAIREWVWAWSASVCRLSYWVYWRSGLQGTMICGWDKTVSANVNRWTRHDWFTFFKGPAVFYVDSDGTRLKGDLFSVGSGSTFAYGVLDQGYRWDLTDEEAQELGRRSIYAAGHRDAFSGNSCNLYHVKEDGWKFIGTLREEYLYVRCYLLS